MSDAVEGADVILYGVSLAYKESACVAHQTLSQSCGSHSDAVIARSNCRMEANVSAH